MSFRQNVLSARYFPTKCPFGKMTFGKCLSARCLSARWADTCLATVEQHYKERRPRTICKGLRILHDNARPIKLGLCRIRWILWGLWSFSIHLTAQISLPVTSGCLTTLNCICLEEILRPTTSLEVPFSSVSKPSPNKSTKKLFISGWSGWNSVFRIRGNILNI